MKKIKLFKKKYPLVFAIFTALIISIIIFIFIICWIHFFTRHGKEYEVPNMLGCTITEMESYSKDSNTHDFVFIINDSLFVEGKKGGIILSQDPKPEMKVKKGRKIYVTTSSFLPPKVEMPNLIDLSVRQAENLLHTNNLKLGQIIYKPSRYPNAILEQRYRGRKIEAGQQIPYHSEITLIVGKEGSIEDFELEETMPESEI